MVQEGWAYNNGVRIHYFDTNPDVPSAQVPVVIVPGVFNLAEDYLGVIAFLAPRRSIAFSLRGRGQSDAPATGYSLQEQAADLGAVIDQSGLDVFCLMAYSLGVPCAIRYAACHPERLAGFIVGDFPARYPALPPGWEERVAGAGQDRIKPHVIHALQQESSEALLWEDLSKFECPALIVRGGQPDSLLTAEESEMYQRYLRYAEIVVLEESGHTLWEPNPDQLLGTLQTFLSQIDDRRSGRPFLGVNTGGTGE